ncbi:MULTISPECIES: zinc-binding dehydrogenase [Corynebacterium]|uniref:Zinc-binding dehydrogenase n=1 Tax=Corynebacterium tuberculostearicum TaxID=38304 RepID=A0AAE4SYE6_9CORY|nr:MULTISPECIES: zinc-binding dehydrogenase [Corynebacterium]MCT1427246.1 zinc-binding dehydrogenase [Corynebacterium sp. p3-SID1241]MDV2419135.1 zinc-binding dehydrogenase [Corynebacterium tuberculostearicum]MDV2432122.1 zinc-binding dehydrogenase [Corynebacterium tuberculostearicum]WKE57630.1 zinc-binding dehydrogenase [Corynebacterium tuberculostearicum]WKE59129.1 zinc-binding dehydrogenase [Corynebacterium tuberculostearicum]
MLVAALVLALVAFVALVNFVISGADWSLYLVFAAAGLGLVCFILDWAHKHRTDKAGAAENPEQESLRAALREE